jgi:hypothetical protein
MWKLTQFLTRLRGKSTCKLFRLVCCLFCFSLCLIGNAQSTNVDFVVVGSAYKMTPDAPYVYDTIPTGCILFWSLKPEDDDRAQIYRSESGHIAYVNNGRLVLAGSDGKPMVWFLNSGLRVWAQVRQPPDAQYAAVYKETPNLLYKNAYDTISIYDRRGIGSYGFLGAETLYGTGGIIGRYGEYLVGSVGGSYCLPILDRANWTQQGYVPAVHLLYNSSDGSLKGEQFRLRWAWRSSDFSLSLDGFKAHLSSKWWLTGKFITDSTGIVSINVSGGNGIGDIVGDGGGDGVSGGVPPDTNDYGGAVPGTIDNPPVNPLGQNGKYVYDPEKKIWQWQGDLADNALQIDPFGQDQPAPTYNTGDLAQESTLRKVLQTLEGFQKDQGIKPEELQAMIDNGVVSLKDGMIEYWEGKHLAEKLDSIDSSVDDAADRIDSSVDAASDRLYVAQNYANGKIDQIKEATIEIRNTATSILSQLGLFGPIVSTLKNVRDSIVNAVNGIQIPENPTADGQDTEDYQIGQPDLYSQIDGWLSLDFPLIEIPVAASLPDYEIGVMGWKIPFSYFSAYNGNWWNILFVRVRMILKWLVYLSATLALCKAMGGGA